MKGVSTEMDVKTKILMLKGEKGDPGGSTWGNISGTLSDQTDLNTALSGKADAADLGPVCFSNDYDDLNGKPNLAVVATSGSYTDLINKPNLAQVATSGSYNDLTNKPNIPTKTSDLTNDSGFVSQSNLVDLVYPVGSYYWSSNSTSPSTLFGGTWTQVKDRFVLAAGDSYSVNATGGEKTHTLTINEMPGHDHRASQWGGLYVWGGANSSKFAEGSGGYETLLSGVNTSSTGEGHSHNNMPPYIVAFCWRRTA